MLWCAQSWTPRAEEVRLLKTARRSMLRRIVGSGRSPTEDFVGWIRRVTRKAEAAADAAHVRDWVKAHYLYKWNWAGHVARRPVDAWVWRATVWRDSAWQSMALETDTNRPLRPSRRRWMKWEDVLRRFCALEAERAWTDTASNRDWWAEHAEEFSSWACQQQQSN